MACVVCVVLSFDTRVRNVRETPVAYSRNVFYGEHTGVSLAVGHSWGQRNGREPTAWRIDFVGLRATSCAKGR